jgi:hypothetical protein
MPTRPQGLGQTSRLFGPPSTGRGNSPTTNSVYGMIGAGKGGWSTSVKYLLGLVLLEILALGGLRHSFRHYHGG